MLFSFHLMFKMIYIYLYGYFFLGLGTLVSTSFKTSEQTNEFNLVSIRICFSLSLFVDTQTLILVGNVCRYVV